MVAERRGCTPRTGAEPDDRERISELSIEERESLSIMHKNAVSNRRAAWGISTNVEQKERTEAHEQQAADARKYAANVCDGILTLIDEELILSASTGEPNVFYYKTETIEEQASKLDGSCAAHAREWKELRRLSDEELVAIRDTNKLLNDSDELIPKWLNDVKGVFDSEDLPMNVYRETLLQNKILRVIKKNHVTKYLDMLAETAELKDDRKKSYEQRGKCSKFGYHEDSAVGVKTAELLKFNTFKPGDEQFSFEEYVDRMKEGQNNICCITGEIIAAVSSRKKGHEVPYVADPVDEYAVQLLKEFEMKLKTTTKEGLDLGDQDERKTLDELNMEAEPLRKLMKEILGDKVDEVNVSNRMVDSLRALTNSEQQRDSSQAVASNNCKQHNKRERKKERKGEGERGQEGRKNEEE